MHLPRTTRSAAVVATTPQSDDCALVSVNPEYLTTDEAAVFLRLSPRTLEKQRVIGGGPRFRKFGARVRYAVTDLRAWADRRAYEMTSESSSVRHPGAR